MEFHSFCSQNQTVSYAANVNFIIRKPQKRYPCVLLQDICDTFGLEGGHSPTET